MQPFTWEVGDRKLIFVSSMQDRGVFRTAIAADIEQLKRKRGPAFVDNNCRVWLNDHAQHGGVSDPAPGHSLPLAHNGTALNTRLIDYQGSVMRALNALTQWVERDVKPLPSTRYTYTEDCDVLLPPRAADRLGVQPVVTLEANGASGRLLVKAGEAVRFVARGETPPKTGYITTAEWDFEGAGTFSVKDDKLTGRQAAVTLTAEHRYAKPGTYFATARLFSTPEGEEPDSIYRLPNLGRIRIIVS